MTEQYLIEKRGLYYRPESAGYTGLKREAGRYTLEEAVAVICGPNGPKSPQDGLRVWLEDDAPEFSSACAWDLRMKEQTRVATVEACIAAVRRTRDAAHYSGTVDYVCGVFDGHARSVEAIEALINQPN